MKKAMKKNKGQGVIEYAGALVIAAVLVATVLAVGPDGIETLFNDILTSVQSFFSDQLDSGLA
ncbi:MAG: hypothetical protein AB7P76_00950 [Candidatus Melainabacteria bacterium]